MLRASLEPWSLACGSHERQESFDQGEGLDRLDLEVVIVGLARWAHEGEPHGVHDLGRNRGVNLGELHRHVEPVDDSGHTSDYDGPCRVVVVSSTTLVRYVCHCASFLSLLNPARSVR